MLILQNLQRQSKLKRKGKGVSFMENNYAWHGAAPNDEQYEQAMKELGGLE